MKETQLERSEAVSSIFKALGHPSRVFIVETLSESPHCVCELSEKIGVSAPTVSRHLSILKEAGIITDRKEGTTVYYSLACKCLGQMVSGAENILKSQHDSRSTVLFSLAGPWIGSTEKLQ